MGNQVIEGQSERFSQWLRPHPDYGMPFIDHVYNTLNAMYLNKWSVNFQTEDDILNWRQAWAAAFDKGRLTPAQVVKGLSECPDHFRSWPPLLGDFIALCKQVTPMMHRPFPKQLEHRAPPAETKANLARLKAYCETLFNKSKIE